MRILGSIYGAEELMGSAQGLAYPALARACRLDRPDDVLWDLVPDERVFPASSPLLERLRTDGAHLWDGRTYVLRQLDASVAWPRLRCSPGSYFDCLNTGTMLRVELQEVAAAASREAANEAVADLYPRLERRYRLHGGARGREAVAQAWSGHGRSAAIAVSCLFVVRAADAFLYCVQRRAVDLADDPGAYHVVPSMVLQDGFSVTDSIFRELAEELFSTDTEVQREPVARAAMVALRESLAAGRADMLVTGVMINLLDLRPEVLALLIVHDSAWFERFGPAMRVSAVEYRDDPDGRASGRGKQVFQELDASALSPEGVFAPERGVVGGAAALIFGLPWLAEEAGPKVAPRQSSVMAASPRGV